MQSANSKITPLSTHYTSYVSPLNSPIRNERSRENTLFRSSNTHVRAIYLERNSMKLASVLFIGAVLFTTALYFSIKSLNGNLCPPDKTNSTGIHKNTTLISTNCDFFDSSWRFCLARVAIFTISIPLLMIYTYECVKSKNNEDEIALNAIENTSTRAV
jgi:hypothetical protein